MCGFESHLRYHIINSHNKLDNSYTIHGGVLVLIGVHHMYIRPLFDERTELKIIVHTKHANSNMRLAAFNYAYAA